MMTAATDRIVFSSSPFDLAEPTHANVHDTRQWAAWFADRGFFRQVDADLSFITPWAILFERGEPSSRELVSRYEAALMPAPRRDDRQARGACSRPSARSAGSPRRAAGGDRPTRGSRTPCARRATQLLISRDQVIGSEAEVGRVNRDLTRLAQELRTTSAQARGARPSGATSCSEARGAPGASPSGRSSAPRAGGPARGPELAAARRRSRAASHAPSAGGCGDGGARGRSGPRTALLHRHPGLRPAARRPRGDASRRSWRRSTATGSGSWSTTPRPTARGHDASRVTCRAEPRIRLLERDVNGHIVAASNDGVDAATRRVRRLPRPRRPPDPRRAGRRRPRRIAAHADVDYLYSDEDKVDDGRRALRRLHQARLVPRAAARPDVHLATCRSCAPSAGARGRRLPRGLRRLPGPRPRPAGQRAGAAGRPHPRGALPLARRRRLRLGRDRRQALRHARGPARRAGPPRPYGRSPRASSRVREPGRYVIQRELDPGIRVSVVIPTLGTSRRRLRPAPRDGRRGRALAARAHRPRGRRGRRRPRRADPTGGARRSCATVAGERLVLVPYAKPFNFSEKMNLGVVASSGSASCSSTTTSR